MLLQKMKRLCIFAICNHLVLSIVFPNLIGQSENNVRFKYLERINGFKPTRTRKILHGEYSLVDRIIRAKSLGKTIS
jgi:hypothetical protein